MDYGVALDLMRNLVEIKRRKDWPEIVMLLEHNPVLTMGRTSKDSDILVSESILNKKGISVYRVERGGMVTYHGPGQLVGYTILDLKKVAVGASDLVYGLEGVILNALSSFGIEGNRKDGYRGVWLGEKKVASIGIAVRGGISFHGFALNYAPDLSHYDLINPCGLQDVRMTSMVKSLDKTIKPGVLRETIASFISEQFDLDLRQYSLEELQERLNQEII